MNTPLPSWNDTATKGATIAFVQTVSDPASPDFVPQPERIATFDNDGTLWCEKPGYIQVAGAIDFLAARAEAEAALRGKHPFKAAYERDLAWFGENSVPDKLPKLLAMLLEAGAGETQGEFEERAGQWLHTASHPRFDVPYIQLIYQPMIELMGYLRANDFKVFICSAGGMDYVRLVSEELYDIPRENVIGSNMALSWESREEGPVLVRQAGIVEPFNDGPGKPMNIQLHIGRRPILAAGNSNGDLAMMEFAAAGRGPFFNLLVHHDDAIREYAYDAGAEIALEAAQKHGWTIASMKKDFHRIFPCGWALSCNSSPIRSWSVLPTAWQP